MQKDRSGAYFLSDEKRLEREAAQRKKLWAGLRKSLPDDEAPIQAWCENDALTVVCFRNERGVGRFRLWHDGELELTISSLE